MMSFVTLAILVAWGRVLTLDILLTIYWFLEAYGIESLILNP